MKYGAVVMGTSSGGMNALKTMLPMLPAGFSLPVIIVQHLSASSENNWINILGKMCRLNIKEADEKEKIEKGTVYIAPPNYHLLVEKDETFTLTIDARVNFARPSIDVLFESAAQAYKEKLIGVILTGASSDGARGMKRIKENGGLTIAQDPGTAEAAFMPSAAICAAAIRHIMPVEQIANFLIETDKQIQST